MDNYLIPALKRSHSKYCIIAFNYINIHINAFCLKPIYRETIPGSVSKTEKVIIVEHTIMGSPGGIVAELLVMECIARSALLSINYTLNLNKTTSPSFTI